MVALYGLARECSKHHLMTSNASEKKMLRQLSIFATKITEDYVRQKNYQKGAQKMLDVALTIFMYGPVHRGHRLVFWVDNLTIIHIKLFRSVIVFTFHSVLLQGHTFNILTFEYYTYMVLNKNLK